MKLRALKSLVLFILATESFAGVGTICAAEKYKDKNGAMQCRKAGNYCKVGTCQYDEKACTANCVDSNGNIIPPPAPGPVDQPNPL